MYTLKILDCKALDGKTWLLCKGNLFDYLDELKAEFYNFSIQRKIVKNQYLDAIVTTVKQGDPIPVITLTYEDKDFNAGLAKDLSIDMGKVEILDGLQRTFRLYVHKVMAEKFLKETDGGEQEIANFTKILKDERPEYFDTGVLSYAKIKSLYADGFTALLDTFKAFDVYFVVWLNLTPPQIIHKMLLLNAGQRSVTKTHQFELLFLYLWEELQHKSSIKLYREKQKEATAIKNGNRQVGEYIFSSVIVALRSYFERKPLRVSIDDLDFDEYYLEKISSDVNEHVFQAQFVGMFLDKIKELDAIVNSIEPEFGLKWFVKDTTLSGMLAAMGEFVGMNMESPLGKISDQTDYVFDLLKEKLVNGSLKLKEFNSQYDVMSSRSVNIGNFIRKVVAHYILELLNDQNPTWENSFNSNLKKL